MKLFLENQTEISGTSFGADSEVQGEVVFTTGMTGYLEILTDPSYFGQIIVFTFPLLGNYGVQDFKTFFDTIDEVYESQKIWAKGVIVAEPSEEFSHYLGKSNFALWLQKNNIPALSGIDTRDLTKKIRKKGVLWGALAHTKKKEFKDVLKGRYVPEVSPKSIQILKPDNPTGKRLAFIDCGAKNGIFREFLKRGIEIIRLPFYQNPFELKESFDGIFFSNGPGDPATLPETINIAKEVLKKDIPAFGICLGNQIIGLASGAKTVKMLYGHRGLNQPVQDVFSKKCLITTQNHGYMIDEKTLENDFEPWFANLNDGTNEGIKHKQKQIFAVQFHPEACAGPEDAQYLFDAFLERL